MIIETHTLWGREFTAEEMERMAARKARLISEGVIYGRMGQFNGVTIREWATEELANAWVEFANSFSPPPLKVEVVTYEDD